MKLAEALTQRADLQVTAECEFAPHEQCVRGLIQLASVESAPRYAG